MTDQIPAWSTTFKQGLSAPADDRVGLAIVAVKKELQFNGVGANMKLSSTCGGAFTRAVREFQKRNGLTPDGEVGPKTGRALWKKRIARVEALHFIPDSWLWKMVGWESMYDPAAIYFNPNDTEDWGLVQSNSRADKLTMAEAYDPATALDYFAGRLEDAAAALAGCEVDKWLLAVAAHRSPVGASYWCDHPELEFPAPDSYNHRGACGPTDKKCWGEQVAYYVTHVSRLAAP